jgi:hypothetical protein
VTTKVKRVWVATPAQGALWCGGTLERWPAANSEADWIEFLEAAPAGEGPQRSF